MTTVADALYKAADRLLTLLWAALIVLMVGGGLQANTANSSTINACNFAPYPISLHWIVPESGLEGEIPLSAGECDVVSPQMNEASTNTRLYAEPAHSVSYEYIKHKSWYQNFWRELGIENPQWPSAQKEGLVHCSQTKEVSNSGAVKSKQCAADEEVRLYSAPLNFDENGRADWILLDFALCDRITDFDCYNASLDEVAIWAADMSAALSRLYHYRNPSSERVGLIPTMAGVVLEDTNRMFNHGIEVKSAHRSTPFGTPIQLKPGDEILFFNGKRIFGQDIAMVVFEAGKKFGYDHVNEVIFRRNGHVYSTEIALFFDDFAYGGIFKSPNGQCREPLVASALSALSEFQFYNQSELSCILDETRGQIRTSQSQCVFERDQFLAAIKQFCPKAAYAGELVGGLSFIGANLVSKTIPKLLPALRGKSLYARSARALLREVGEETARALLTQPPGLNTEAVISDIVTRGKLQGAIGVGFQVAPLITGALIVPMIYDSFQRL